MGSSGINAVRLSQNPPGRFLQKDRRTKLWFDVGDQRAQEETARALREGEPQKDANTSTSVMDSALNAAATIQLAHSNATAKQQQQQQQQAGVAAMASSSAVTGGGDSKLPAQQNASRRASSTSLSSADAADAITSMRHLIDRSVITSSTSSSNTSGVASQRTSLEPVPLRGSFLSSAAALSIKPNPIPLPASSSGGSVAARASRMANQMMPPPRAMS